MQSRLMETRMPCSEPRLGRQALSGAQNAAKTRAAGVGGDLMLDYATAVGRNRAAGHLPSDSQTTTKGLVRRLKTRPRVLDLMVSNLLNTRNYGRISYYSADMACSSLINLAIWRNPLRNSAQGVSSRGLFRHRSSRSTASDHLTGEREKKGEGESND